MGIKRYIALAASATFVVGLHAEQVRLQDLEGETLGFARPGVTLPSEAVKKLPDDITIAKQNIKGASQVLDQLVQMYKSKKQTPIKGQIFSTLVRGFMHLQTLLKLLAQDLSDLGSEEADDAIKAAINMTQAEINAIKTAINVTRAEINLRGKSQEEAAMVLAAVNSILNHARIKARGQVATAKLLAKSPAALETKMRAFNDTLQQAYNVTHAMTSALNVSSIA